MASHPPPHPPRQAVSLFGSTYVLPYETTLVLKEKFTLSGDDMDIKDVTGVCHFKLKAKVISVRQKRALYDSAGRPICCTMNNILSFRKKVFICPGEEPEKTKALAEVRKGLHFLRREAQVFYKDNGSHIPNLIIQGSIFDRAFQILDGGGRPLATVSRDILTAGSIFFGKATYYLRIFPGVDTALMVILVTVIEEMYVEANQKKNNN